jgi:hypothetical protein
LNHQLFTSQRATVGVGHDFRQSRPVTSGT